MRIPRKPTVTARRWPVGNTAARSTLRSEKARNRKHSAVSGAMRAAGSAPARSRASATAAIVAINPAAPSTTARVRRGAVGSPRSHREAPARRKQSAVERFITASHERSRAHAPTRTTAPTRALHAATAAHQPCSARDAGEPGVRLMRGPPRSWHPPTVSRPRRLLREVVPGGDAVRGRQLEPLRLPGLELDAKSPDRLAGHAVRELVRTRHHVGEPEVALLVGPQIVAFVLRRAVRLPDEEQLQPRHRLDRRSILAERGVPLEARVSGGALRLRARRGGDRRGWAERPPARATGGRPGPRRSPAGRTGAPT